MTDFRPRLLSDDEEEWEKAAHFRPLAAVTFEARGSRETSAVVAPCCGRSRLALEVQEVPGLGWICSPCRGRLHRDPESPWTHASMARAQGADPNTFRHLEFVEEVRRARQERGREVVERAVVRAVAEARVAEREARR